MTRCASGVGLLAIWVGAGVLAGVARAGEMRGIPHPYILWTKKEAAALKKRIETDPAAKKQYDEMARVQRGNAILNLFD